MANDLEHAALVSEIIKAASDNGNDPVDLIRRFSVMISDLRNAAVAEELDRQATVQWDVSTMIEPAQKVLSEAGEEAGAALLDVSIRTMREVSARLKRRAAEVRGITPEELAMRGVLTLPLDTTAPPQAAPGGQSSTPDVPPEPKKEEPGEPTVE